MNVKMVNRINEVVKEIRDLEVIDEAARILEEARKRIEETREGIGREQREGFWVGKIPCWEICQCPDIVKNECPAHKYPNVPCWQIDGTYCKLDDYAANGADTSICKLCRVYKQYGDNKPIEIKLFGKGIDTSLRTVTELVRKKGAKA